MTATGPRREPARPPRLASRLAPVVRRAESSWAGRTVLLTIAEVGRVELFDRAMTAAAQLFTSVFPVLIVSATWLGKGTDRRVADEVDLPVATRTVLSAAINGTGTASFGIIGTVVVLLSATSLSRALTRAFAVIWEVPRPRTRIRTVWRWLAALLGVVVCLVAVRTLSRFTDRLPPQHGWTLLLTLLATTAIALLVPWLLLYGQVAARQLGPGAVVFGLVMLGVRPVGTAYLPRALETSSHRYGPIGVAFTYLGWLYVVSFGFLAAAVVGRALAEDEGRLGQLLRADPHRAVDRH